MSIRLIIFTILSCIIFGSCKTDKYISQPAGLGNIQININYNVDSSPLSFDTVFYKNEAGNTYNVSRLQYYISRLRFYKNDVLTYSIDSIFYIDARVIKTNTILLSDVPSFNYDKIDFNIGIVNELNSHNKLPTTSENLAMEWPDGMGGGYHFLKLEGHFVDSSIDYGYAMHIGTNNMQPNCSVKKELYVPIKSAAVLNLVMNVNEWFKNPYTYNFSTDGVYSMGNMALMRKLQSNGNDVFYAQ